MPINLHSMYCQALDLEYRLALPSSCVAAYPLHLSAFLAFSELAEWIAEPPEYSLALQ
jgi:hypothetical protein